MRRLDRYVTHAVVLLVAALMSGYSLGMYFQPGSVAVAAANPAITAGDNWLGRDSTIIKPVYIPTAPLPNRAPIIYTVGALDTLDSIAKHFGVPFREITWSNPGLKLPLKPGEILRLPPVPGFVIAVRKGDTLAGLSRAYGLDPNAVVDFNRIQGPLTPGSLLVIPVDPGIGPTLASGKVADPIAPGKLLCPIQGAPIIQKFGPTGFALEPSYGGYLHFHTGVDVLAGYGTPITAAAGGVVTSVAFEDYYGNEVTIRDSYGLVEIYAHLEAGLVTVGQPVQQGQPIALVGSTGLSIGAHLHLQFEIGGVPTDPMPLLGCSASS